MTAIEMMLLTSYGYEAIPDPEYGYLFVPAGGSELEEKRRTCTLIDIRMKVEELRVTQAIQNLTEESALSRWFMEFVKPKGLPSHCYVSPPFPPLPSIKS